MTFMVENLVSIEEKRDLKIVFDEIDVNLDGSISPEELYDYFKKIRMPNVQEEVDKIFKIADADGSGTIEFTEWCTATIDKKILLTT